MKKTLLFSLLIALPLIGANCFGAIRSAERWAKMEKAKPLLPEVLLLPEVSASLRALLVGLQAASANSDKEMTKAEIKALLCKAYKPEFIKRDKVIMYDVKKVPRNKPEVRFVSEEYWEEAKASLVKSGYRQQPNNGGVVYKIFYDKVD